MIKELHISNLAVIEDTTLEFNTPYTALIGETGAGKSLIVNSLSLLSGERCDFALIRDKEKKASVSAVFCLTESFIEDHSELKEVLDETQELILRRVFSPDKTSRCYVNDTPVSLNEFKALSAPLIDIHSQNGKSQLLDESKQILYVDRFAGDKLKKAKETYLQSFRQWKAKQNELNDLIKTNQELDRDYLTFQIAEIEKYHLEENEIEALNEEYESLKGYDRLKSKYEEFLSETEYGEMGLTDRLAKAVTKLRGLADTELADPAKEAQAACQNALNCLSNLDASFHDISADPRRIDEINERLFALKGLQRKYGKTTREILAKYQDYQNKLAMIQSFETQKLDLENEIKVCYETALKSALDMSQIRKKAAFEMSSRIGLEMADLGLRKNAFSIVFHSHELTSEGQDEVSFMVCLNEGLEPASLAKAASGGEASRLMLSLKVVLNALNPYDVLVFDEIDTGVSGYTASLMAKKIQTISSSSAVIVISHLPQVVASCSDAIFISKKSQEGMTTTYAKSLNRDQLTEQIGRMLSGDKLTPSAISQAQELIQEFHQDDKR